MTRDDWDGGFEAEQAEKRAGWASMTPAQLLEWLEDAITFAAAAGALTEDRRRRAAEAATWAA